MSDAASAPVFHGTRSAQDAVQVWPTLLVALLGVFAVSLPNLTDPMIRYDDFPALLADPSGFWEKTLHEGRWVNYLWHERGFVTPSWLNFAAYQALWAVFAACLAVVALGRNASPWFCGILALTIVIAPPATLIALWFNTLLPGLALVALYAWLGCRLSPQLHRLLLLPFVVVTFMAYTTYPLLLLAVCLARSGHRSLRDLVGVLALFTFSFAAAVLSVYTINLQVHGVFGVPLADWRDATPAADLSGLIANLPLVRDSFGDFLEAASFGFGPAIYFHLGLLTLASLVLLRRAPTEAAYLHAGLWIGIALVVVQVLKMGAMVPPRGFIFAWVFYAILIVRAAQLLCADQKLPGRLMQNAVLLILGSYLLQTFQQYATYRPWQQETRALAARIATIDGPVTITGDVTALPSAQAAFVQNGLGLVFRMEQLAGRTVALCAKTTCDAAKSGVVYRATPSGLTRQ